MQLTPGPGVFPQQPGGEVDQCRSALLTLTDKLTQRPADRRRLLQVSAATTALLGREEAPASLHSLFPLFVSGRVRPEF